jgi:hypothetical protein
MENQLQALSYKLQGKPNSCQLPVASKSMELPTSFKRMPPLKMTTSRKSA